MLKSFSHLFWPLFRVEGEGFAPLSGAKPELSMFSRVFYGPYGRELAQVLSLFADFRFEPHEISRQLQGALRVPRAETRLTVYRPLQVFVTFS